MPRKRKKERVPGQYYDWLLGTRDNGVYYADGRSNKPDLGRHSLDTREREAALENLRRLDLVKAVEFGKADAALLKEDQNKLLSLEDGQKRYMEHVSRPAVQGGASPGTVKRYRAILEKFVPFATKQNVRFWQQVTKEVLNKYGKWLHDKDYDGATQYMELTTVKQVVKFLVGEGLLPATALITMKLKKPQGTTTYCYSPAEFRAMVEFCRGRDDLGWMGDVVLALGMTGLRISELAGLRWSDIDLERELLTLTDTSRRVNKSRRAEARTTKSHKDRSLFIHEQLLPVLKRLPRHADGRVFHGPKGGRLKPDTVRNVLTREVLPALAERFPAGEQGPGIEAGRVHSLRHFFCSMSADSNTPEQMLMSWLGHQDSGMIRRYYHARHEASRSQMNKIRFLDDATSSSDGAAK